MTMLVHSCGSSADRKGRNSNRKTRQERREMPLFGTVVEVCSHDKWYVHTDVARNVDALLAGKGVSVQRREYTNGRMIASSQYIETDHQQGSTIGGDTGSLNWIDDLFQAANSGS